MNKYIILGGAGVLLLGLGLIYNLFLLPSRSVPVETGEMREITIIAKKDQWRFVPEVIEVNRGDRIKLTLVNEDDYDHGFTIDALGITPRMPANETIQVEFVATQEGEFPFFCSVPCGEGIVDGEERTHFDMIGKLHVRSAISETK
ncbi:MAG: Uncharacterized protein G01um101466_516 [Parcubacteria group bacterium Gr01-1014_66]|nr:MAG: Uncharacterized protein G01um101466_516 [Parcubacteria group bacterium Gr01-1014_66]